MGFSRLNFFNARYESGYRCALSLVPSTAEQGAGGDEQVSWGGTAMQVLGRWRITNSRENVMEGGKYSMVAGVWEIPWVPNMTTRHRVEFGSPPRKYRIVGIENIQEKNQRLNLFVAEDEGAEGVAG